MKFQRLCRSLPALVCTFCLLSPAIAEKKHHETPFGTDEPEDGALHGKIYSLPVNTRSLPDFETLRPTGDLYAWSLWVTTRDTFPWHGLPGSEWYAIDYRGTFFMPKDTRVKFFLLSDDGSRLYIDDRCVINNDGVHASAVRGVSVRIPEGPHRIRISYFQGPAPYVALALAVQLPGQGEKPFDIRDFLPPDSAALEPALQQRKQ
jgi:hypothetical protein